MYWVRVESSFRNRTVVFFFFKAYSDNQFKRTNHAKFCMLPSLDRTLPESLISHKNNSPLALYTDFHNFQIFLISIVRLIKFNHKCIHNHLSPYIPKYKSRGKICFHKK